MATGGEVRFKDLERVAFDNTPWAFEGETATPTDYNLSGLAADGTSGQCIGTDGSGNLGWVSAGGGSGDVSGPGSSTDGDVVLFDGTTGKLIKDAGFTGASVYRAGGTDVAVADGGTNISSYAQGDLLYASASTTLSKLAKDTNTTRYLSNQGTSNNPSWNQVNLANGVTGTLPVANGGTGGTSLTGVLIGNGTSAISAVNSLTDNHPVRADGSGSVQDVANWTYADTTGASAFSGAISGGKALDVTNTSGANASYAIRGYESGTTLNTVGVRGEVDSTGAPYGVQGISNGGTGTGIGVFGSTASSDNAAYSVYANEHGYLGDYSDLPTVSAPASPPSGTLRFFQTADTLKQKDSAGNVKQVAYTSDVPALYGPSTYMNPSLGGGLADSAAGTRTITSGSTMCVYVGRAAKAFSSCTIYYDVTTAPTLVSAGSIGLCKGTAPDAGNASLTYLGHATITGGSDIGLGAHKKAVTLTTSAAAGDDIWACISWTSTGAGVLHACVADLCQVGAGQSAASVFSASGSEWNSQATTTDGATASIMLKVRVLW